MNSPLEIREVRLRGLHRQALSATTPGRKPPGAYGVQQGPHDLQLYTPFVSLTALVIWVQ
jgi:hypothetical protein